GCRVLTRPSIISGKPVRSATSLTGRPKPAIAALVPPVETSSTPSPARVRAASSSPALSDREIRARTGLIASGAGGKSGAAGMGGVRLRLGRGDGGASSTNGTRRQPLLGIAARAGRAQLPADLGFGVGAGRAAHDDLQGAAGPALAGVGGRPEAHGGAGASGPPGPA